MLDRFVKLEQELMGMRVTNFEELNNFFNILTEYYKEEFPDIKPGKIDYYCLYKRTQSFKNSRWSYVFYDEKDSAYYTFELINIIFSFINCLNDLNTIANEKEINGIKLKMKEIANAFSRKIIQAEDASNTYRYNFFHTILIKAGLFTEHGSKLLANYMEEILKKTDKELIEYSKKFKKPREALAIGLRTDGQEETISCFQLV